MFTTQQRKGSIPEQTLHRNCPAHQLGSHTWAAARCPAWAHGLERLALHQSPLTGLCSALRYSSMAALRPDRAPQTAPCRCPGFASVGPVQALSLRWGGLTALL